jgi:DNA-binding Xre family transcriptional regulator
LNILQEEEQVRQLCERFGDVRPRLERLRLLTQYRWDRKVSYQDIISSVGLGQHAVRMLANPAIRFYNLEAIKRLCWYFGSTPADLLARVQPAGSPYPPAGEPQLGRQAPPGTPLPRQLAPGTITLVNKLPDLLAWYAENDLAAALRLDRSTVYRLRHKPGARIGRWTLAAACTFLSGIEERDVGLNELLVYEGPTCPDAIGAG